jgi:hypothetical protein
VNDVKLELIDFLESLGDGESLVSVLGDHLVTCRAPSGGTYYELAGEKWTRLDLLADKMLALSLQWEYYIGEDSEGVSFMFGEDEDTGKDKGTAGKWYNTDCDPEDEDADDPLFGGNW